MEEKIFLELTNLGYIKQNTQLHISFARDYGLSLQLIYGGDIEIIEYGIIIRELTEVNKEFKEFSSVKENLELILSNTGLSTKKIETIVDHFIQGEKETKSSYSIEEKIITDSTSLSWFGMKGIVKIQEYSDIEGIGLLQTIEILLKKPFALFFQESINTEEREKKFTNLFKDCLKVENKLVMAYPGKYIVLEGNSGTGKDSQAEMLEKKLTNLGKKVKVIIEPSEFFRDLEGYWNKKNGKVLSLEKPLFRLYAIIGDRLDQINGKVIRALEDDCIVISVRSYLSMLVYQCDDENSQLYINYLHQFNPRPDCVIIYDLDENACVERISKRGATISVFDKLQSLQRHRPKYLQLLNSSFLNFPIEIINANQTIEQISQETLSIVQKYLN